MSRLLFLACGQSYAYTDLANRSILHGLPGRVTVLANAAIAGCFDSAGVERHTVRWHDAPSVEKKVAALHAEQPFTAVATIDERLMEAAARMRDLLGLPGMKPPEVPRFRDKLTMKRQLAAAGLRVPEFTSCDDRAAVEALLARHGCIVIKPVDGVGSSGVIFANSSEDVARWYTEQAQPGRFEAEEFIDGPLYQVDAVVQGGFPVHTAVASYLPGLGCIDFSTGAPLARVLLDDSLLRRQLVAFSDRVIHGLAMQDGVTHLECFVTPAGEVVFCEVAARPAGGGSLQMHEAHTGINFARTAVLLAVGRAEEACRTPVRPEGTVGMVAFRAAAPSRVERIASVEEFDEPWIRYRRIDCAEGDLVSSAAHCSDYIAFFVFAGPDRKAFDERLATLRTRFESRLALAPL